MTRAELGRSLVSAMLGGLVTTAAYALTVRQDLRDLRSRVDEMQRSMCWMARQSSQAQPPICFKQLDSNNAFSLGRSGVQAR